MLQTMASPLVLLLAGIKLLSLTTCDEIDVKQMQSSLTQIGRQLMLQQLFVEERIRSDGDSGLKIIRLNNIGPRPYYGEGVSSAKKVNAIQVLFILIRRTNRCFSMVQAMYTSNLVYISHQTIPILGCSYTQP